MRTHISSEYDTVIVGGRCAGAATAMLLARAGQRVMVIERDDFGTDTLSTHALMRLGVALLARWGVLDGIVADGTPLVRQTTFTYGDERVEIDIRPDGEIPGLFAPRRSVLDRHLVKSAMAAGAEFRFGTSAEELIRDATGRVRGVLVRDRCGARIPVCAHHVIGADGRGSMVARTVGAREICAAPATSAGLYGYVPGIRNLGYRWYFRRNAHLAVIPTNAGEHCVCAVGPRAKYRDLFGSDPEARFRDVVLSFDPEVGEALRFAPEPLKLRRWAGARGYMRECEGPGWALVGDAGYFKDPLTAHGITDAFRDATLLTEAILSPDAAGPARYAQTRSRLSQPLFDVTARIAGFGWSLDDLKALHLDLNATMKSEFAFMQNAQAPLKIPAE